MQKKINARQIARTLLLALAATLPTLATAQTAHQTLKEAAQGAVLNNPEVQARWHAFREATEEIDVARGGLLPRLDLSTGVGREKLKQASVGIDSEYTRRGYTLSLNQMVFDGFATANEVKRLGKAKLVRYFELLDATENTALEAARAYLDVARSRDLVLLAEENYTQHYTALEQLKLRAQSGVGKRVDVDQAASRLALADVNLTTAYANLHDVSARYLRLVGSQPPKVMFPPANTARDLPGSVDAALQIALQRSPALRATIENIEAAQFDLDERRAAFMPKVDLRARNDLINNNLGVAGNRDNAVLEMVLSYNLFNGGTDSARSRQFRERKNIALDQREKACRDLRQTLSIAYNDTLRLNDQLSYIGSQVSLVEKTRTAYRDQFNIGQRTLLDLLNTQNEFFDARRAQVNADADLTLAYLRSYAGMGRLLEHLGLKRGDAESTPDERDLAGVDPAQLCPPSAPLDVQLDRDELGRKAREATEKSRESFLAGRAPVAATAVPVAPMEPKPVVGPAAELAARVKQWQAAWAARDTGRYLDFYADGFVSEAGLDRPAWVRQRTQRLARAAGIGIEIRDLAVRMSGPDLALAEFRQAYVADGFSDTTDKTLTWRKENGQWKIVRETARPVGRGQ